MHTQKHTHQRQISLTVCIAVAPFNPHPALLDSVYVAMVLRKMSAEGRRHLQGIGGCIFFFFATDNSDASFPFQGRFMVELAVLGRRNDFPKVSSDSHPHTPSLGKDSFCLNWKQHVQPWASWPHRAPAGRGSRLRMPMVLPLPSPPSALQTSSWIRRTPNQKLHHILFLCECVTSYKKVVNNLPVYPFPWLFPFLASKRGHTLITIWSFLVVSLKIWSSMIWLLFYLIIYCQLLRETVCVTVSLARWRASHLLDVLLSVMRVLWNGFQVEMNNIMVLVRKKFNDNWICLWNFEFGHAVHFNFSSCNASEIEKSCP